MDPAVTVRRIPLAPHDHSEEITPTDDLFVLAHLGIPQVDAADWSFGISGLVRQPTAFSLADLKTFPKRSIQTVHECAGNPVTPSVPTRRVGNVVWAGVELTTILDVVGVDDHASYLWSYGMDSGEFEGTNVDHYLKDLSLLRVAAGDVLIAYELNGKPLPPEHGFPARLLVPGFYGTNSVKWLHRMELADGRADGLFTTRYYNDEIPPDATHPEPRSRPVWEIAPESVIVSPAPNTALTREKLEISGWAWASNGIAAVEISDDDGATWRTAEIGAQTEWSWQRFRLDWTPSKSGRVNLASRAFSASGECQPLLGQRNAIYTVSVDIAPSPSEGE